MKYIVTVTDQKVNPMKYTHDDAEVVHSERRNNHGSLLLWCKQWFKTQGGNRKFQKRGKGREVMPKDYVTTEIYIDMNFRGTQNWQLAYSGNWFDEAYARIAGDRKRMRDELDIELSTNHPEWGLAIVDVYSKKRPEWTRLWVRAEDDDGNELLDTELPEDEWV